MSSQVERQRQDHSVTIVDHHRRREEARRLGALFIVGDSFAPGVPSGERVVEFDTFLHIGRRPPADASARAWVVKDQLVSSQHCVIVKEAETYKLNDLGSRNGTAVDGQLVKDPVKLRDGALIFIGTQIAVFRTMLETERDAIAAELASPLGPVPTASPEFAAVCQTLRKLATSECEILLTGETGVGKEVYAQAIHRLSGRTGRFVAINCAALPRELVESELFGYVRGAHSQARDAKRGLFEESEGGTLFLDEIGEMPADLQTKLLRFLQDRQIVPLGSTRPRRLDTRVLAATSRTTAPKAGSTIGLRADLSARLGAEPIRLPPLRHRVEDLGALIAHFLGSNLLPFEPLAFQALALHNWPGNVRELEKVMSNAELLARGTDSIALEHLPAAIAATPARLKSQPAGSAGRPPPPNAAELEAMLQRFHGNVLRVAREVGRTPPLIYRWCRRYKLDPEHFRLKE
jgi:transcriptional regulator with PAS, ATPase and Fis domain